MAATNLRQSRRVDHGHDVFLLADDFLEVLVHLTLMVRLTHLKAAGRDVGAWTG
jgi:hypothetical protein